MEKVQGLYMFCLMIWDKGLKSQMSSLVSGDFPMDNFVRPVRWFIDVFLEYFFQASHSWGALLLFSSFVDGGSHRLSTVTHLSMRHQGLEVA